MDTHQPHGAPLFARHINRRRFLTVAGGAAALALTTHVLPSGALTRGAFGAYPFTLGVASGDPLPDSVVLWTRLAPQPLAADGRGGMPAQRVLVRWEVAADAGFKHSVRRGTTLALPEDAHAVHVEVPGLAPGREYYYRFMAGAEVSPIGRTKTAPASGARVDQLAFAFCSCQAWQDGYYTAYRHLAQEDLDLVVHLGDYIYEGGVTAQALRQHDGPEPLTLAAYRNRHALYKTDPDLQAAHAAFPFLVIWDDHEVENNYADRVAQLEPGRSIEAHAPERFLSRRASAYRAYYEHLSLRWTAIPRGPSLQLYRRLSYGDLATFHLLDTRQQRANQACAAEREPDREPPCPAQADPRRSITGAEQEAWLYAGLDRSATRWNVIAQQVFLARRDFRPGSAQAYNMDAWDGYLASQQRLLTFLAERRPTNPVVITGNEHANWVADLKADFTDPTSATVGTELVGTSISSDGDGKDIKPTDDPGLAENPHIRFHNAQRGYVRCQLSPDRWQTDFRVVPYVSRPGAPIGTRATFVVEAGRPGAQPA